MCRSIRTLHNFDPPASDDEIRAAAVQYVRKVAGASKPSRANEAAYERAVDAVAEATKARARSAQRFAVENAVAYPTKSRYAFARRTGDASAAAPRARNAPSA